MDTIISSVARELSDQLSPAPDGFLWEKQPDHYDHDCDIIWEGSWTLVPNYQSPRNKCKDFKQEFKYSNLSNYNYNYDLSCNYNRDLSCKVCPETNDGPNEEVIIQKQKISKTLNPSYHVCDHTTHKVCSESPCCDFFWHDGECKYVSDDGNCGYAVRFGDQ
jgi:hypothetical protein